MECGRLGLALRRRVMVASPRFLSRATNTIRAPIFASRCAATSPMPEVPPVITTTLPRIYFLLLRQTVVKRQIQQDSIARGVTPYKSLDHLNQSHNMGIEFRQHLRGNPILSMHRTADRPHRKTAKITRVHGEPSDKSGPASLHIPVPRDLRRIGMISHRIENRQLRQSRRKFPSPRVLD